MAQDAGGRGGEIEPERLADAIFERALDRDVERHLAAEKAIGAERRDEIGVGDGRSLPPRP